MAHVRQFRPDSGLGFEAKVLKTFEVFPLLLEAEHCSHLERADRIE